MGVRSSRTQQKKRTYAIAIILILIILILLMNLFTYVLSVVKYYGDGMEPALKNGDLLIVLRTKSVEPGDIAAFYYNNQILVRRIMAEGTQQITVETDGSVLVDGQTVEESYLDSPSLGQSNQTYPCYVPEGQFFVMGDNRAEAMDSRLKEIGTIPEDRIMGKVIFAF
ncbi:MAG: signal peptidase I [Firmicutes bacterium]|nr:signal peptidase I [Bacillota bacterium]